MIFTTWSEWGWMKHVHVDSCFSRTCPANLTPHPCLPSTLPLVGPELVACPIRFSLSPSGRPRYSFFLVPSGLLHSPGLSLYAAKIHVPLTPPCSLVCWAMVTRLGQEPWQLLLLLGFHDANIPPEGLGKKEEQAWEGKWAMTCITEVCNLYPDLKFFLVWAPWSLILRFAWMSTELDSSTQNRRKLSYSRPEVFVFLNEKRNLSCPQPSSQ